MSNGIQFWKPTRDANGFDGVAENVVGDRVTGRTLAARAVVAEALRMRRALVAARARLELAQLKRDVDVAKQQKHWSVTE